MTNATDGLRLRPRPLVRGPGLRPPDLAHGPLLRVVRAPEAEPAGDDALFDAPKRRRARTSASWICWQGGRG
ncbi:hypothetical protein ACWDV7_39520 [Streptomyces sp. NPDC003362]